MNPYKKPRYLNICPDGREPIGKLWVLAEKRQIGAVPNLGFAVCGGLPKKYGRKAWWKVLRIAETEAEAEQLLDGVSCDHGRAMVDLSYSKLHVVWI